MALLLQSACGDPVQPLPQEGAPEALAFSIGGFGVGSRSWEVRGDTVVFRRIPWDPPAAPVASVRVVPTPEAWRDFWRAAERAGVRRWRGRYVARGVVDGVGWEMRLVAGRLRIEAQGSNAFPDRFGRKHDLGIPSDFEAFVAALAALVETPR